MRKYNSFLIKEKCMRLTGRQSGDKMENNMQKLSTEGEVNKVDNLMKPEGNLRSTKFF